jgi:Ca-activated chloride channel family protein
MFSFEHTAYLAGLLIIIPFTLLFYGVLQWKKKVKKALGDEHLINRLIQNYSANRFTIKFVLVSAVLALLIAAVANLRKSVAGEAEKRAGIDVMIALDVSKSMWAEDTKPSRLDASKQFTSQLLNKISNNRVGLVLFAGRAFLQMPLTPDLNVAGLYVSNASPEALPVQGTVVSDALQLCKNALDTKEKKYKAVVLISDGEDHNPNTAGILQQLADEGIIVNTVGVGSPEGSPITEPGAATYKMDITGKTVISKLNEEELIKIAQQTGGVYTHLDNTETAATKVAALLNSMEKKAIQGATDEKQYTSFYSFFVLLALVILITEIFIPDVKRKTG